jgi:hypothetical protein
MPTVTGIALLPFVQKNVMDGRTIQDSDSPMYAAGYEIYGVVRAYEGEAFESRAM